MEQDLNALNKQAIAISKKYTGALAWPTVALVALVLVGFVTNLWLFVAGVTPLWAATLIYAALTYMSYTPLHEAAHGNIHGSRERLRWLNDLCGYLTAPLMMVPYSTHKVEHFTHHRYTNQPEKDPDFVVSGMRHGFLAFIRCGFKLLWTQNTFLFRDHWATMPRRERAIYFAEVALAISWRLAFLAIFPTASTLVLLVIGFLTGGLFTLYWFAYRPHLPYQETARYRNTNSMIMPVWMKPLEWFWFGQNLHSIHHAFPRVPFYHYHALFREIEPIMRAHGAPVIGIFDRRPVRA